MTFPKFYLFIGNCNDKLAPLQQQALVWLPPVSKQKTNSQGRHALVVCVHCPVCHSRITPKFWVSEVPCTQPCKHPSQGQSSPRAGYNHTAVNCFSTREVQVTPRNVGSMAECRPTLACSKNGFLCLHSAQVLFS